MSRRHEPDADLSEDPDDVQDLDHELDEAEDEDDGPVPIACGWGMPGWCATGRHHRCYFTTHADEIKTGTYGHDEGHVWTCPCACHANQAYPILPAARPCGP